MWQMLRWASPAVIVMAVTVVVTRPASACELQTEDAAATPEWVHAGDTRAAVIGDSWSTAAGEAWPGILARDLGLDLRVAAFGGTGYTNGSACGGRHFRTSVVDVPRDAELVILAGGVNDTGVRPEVLRVEVGRVLDAVHERAPRARVVVLGVPRVELIGDAETARADLAIRAAAGDLFVDVRGWDIALLSDEIHPSTRGHRTYAEHIAAAIE